MSKKMYAGLFVMLIVNYILWLYAFNPCITSFDSGYLYNQAHNMGKVSMLDWHPPFYAIIVSMILKIYDSATFVVIIQCVFFSLVYMDFIKYLYNKGMDKEVVMLVYIFGGFSFNNTMQMVTLWKDIPYMISLLWLTILCVKIEVDYDEYTHKLSWYVEMIVSLVFTSLFRQNGIVPAVGTVITVGIYMLLMKCKKYFIVIVSFVSIFFLIKGPVYDYYKVEKADGLKYFALANDIVCLNEDGYDLSEDALDIVSQVKDGNTNLNAYSPYYTSYNDSAFKGYSMSKFIKGYMEAFKMHPIQLSLNVLRRNVVIWGIFPAKMEVQGFTNYTEEFTGEWFDYKYPYRVENRLTDLFNTISLLLSPFLMIFVWKTGIYLLFILYCFVYLLRTKENRKYIIMCFPILLNECALFIGSGWSDYRYFWPTEMISYIIITVTIYIKTQISKDKRNE